MVLLHADSQFYLKNAAVLTSLYGNKESLSALPVIEYANTYGVKEYNKGKILP